MNNETEKTLNTIAYILIIIAEIIYIYVTQKDNEITDEEKNTLVKLGRKILFITAIYFIINAFIGLKKEKNKSQYKQVIAAIFALIASFIRLTIKDDDITFR